MIATYEELAPERLAGMGFDDPAQACRLLQGMAGHDVPDAAFNRFLATATQALEACADPDRAVANLAQWAERVGSRVAAYNLLAGEPVGARMLVTLFAASQFLADLILHTPEYLEVLLNPRIRDRGRDADALWADLVRRVEIARTPNAQRDALRRFKPPEVLRIGARDVLGFATIAETIREISDFADVCVRMALQIAGQERSLSQPNFAVIAMGKLGGWELNYASDIDLIFVHGDEFPTGEALKLGEAVRDTLAKATDAGFVFRVDLRLRPEGRFGPVSRSLSSCRAYYESWAEPWERQALLKARFVAGDEQLGAAFLQMTQAFVYPARVDEVFVESIRRNKRRIEQKVMGAGESDVNVKEGRGGIRDVEFATQLLQLIAGGAHPALRTGNTLAALAALQAQGLLTADESETLGGSYLFLRDVEHRLQLMDEQAVRCLPRDAKELNKFGRRLGYADGAAFTQEYVRHAGLVHALFSRLFYGGVEEDASGDVDQLTEWALASDDPAAQEGLRDALAQRGFKSPEEALALMRRSVSGSEYGGITPEARAGFAALAPHLLDGAAITSNPDGALRGLDALAQAVSSRAALYRTLIESPTLLPRLCRLAGDSPFLWQTLLAHLEFLDALADDEAMDAPPTLRPASQILPALGAACLRARLQTGARDIWSLADSTQVMAEITKTAEAALSAAIALARQEIALEGGFSVIGLGKLGGSELGYASDLDVLYVAEPGQLAQAARLAERVQQILGSELARYGVRFEVDARLRPEGRKGALVLDLETYRRYYAQSAATWERQALLKARFAAGDESLGQQFRALAEEAVYGASFHDAQFAEVRAMKRRIETERLHDPRDLKLGPGGLADIEWTAQILQLEHGRKRPRLRKTGTLPALLALRDDALITQAEWETLSETYARLTALRNHLYLQTGVASDIPPTQPDDLHQRRQAAREICLHRFYRTSTIS